MASPEKVSILILLLYLGISINITGTTADMQSPGSRNPLISISKQLAFGIKRGVYYLDSLIENCNDVNDINDWLHFIDSYLKCDAQAESTILKQLRKEGLHAQRLSLLCKQWPLRKKCSFKLATRLNSCLDPHLEDGKAGTNALRLADAHMKFLCENRIEYSDNLRFSDTEANEVVDYLPVEQRPLNCYHELEGAVNDCIIGKQRREEPLETFCSKFQVAKECLSAVYEKSCEVKTTQEFLEIMLDQIEFELEC